MTARQRKLSREEAQRKALELWEKGWVVERLHERRRSGQRQFDDQDVLNVLKNGKIRKEPVWDEQFKNWEYVIHGADLEGDPLAIVFAFDEEFTELYLITGKGW